MCSNIIGPVSLPLCLCASVAILRFKINQRLNAKQRARAARIKLTNKVYAVAKFPELNRALAGNKRVDENILPQRAHRRCSHHKRG